METGWIYLVKSLHLYKIGKSKNSPKRIKVFKTYNPHGVMVVCQGRIKYYEQCERLLHLKYKKYRVSGEWFDLTDKHIEDIKQYIFTRLTSKLAQHVWLNPND